MPAAALIAQCIWATIVQVVYLIRPQPADLLGGGFILPDSEIQPTGEANLAATLSYGESLLQQHIARNA